MCNFFRSPFSRFNLFGKCPKCGSKKYMKLFVGHHDKSCLACGVPYDFLPEYRCDELKPGWMGEE
jgi:uncharacterized protein (DUF983 family)